VLASARAALELWSDPDVCRFTASNTVDVAALRRRKTAVYIIVYWFSGNVTLWVAA
jgi:type IV secretory pathway TraG/TraD family ATPase VirD4